MIADVPDVEPPFGAAESDALPPLPKSPLIPVFGVALGALGIGLVAGFLILNREEPNGERPLVTPGLAPVRSVTPPKVKSAAPKKKAQDLPPEAQPAVDEPPVDVAPTPSAGAAKDLRPAAPLPAASSPKPAASQSAAPAPAAPPSAWVKPAWAIPDEEGPIRRAPIDE